MGTLNLGKVVGTDAKINGQTAVTMTGANGVSVTTEGQTVTIDGKSIVDQIPTTLPANGGNADTIGNLHVNEIASNPNILINPDFKINQRGETSWAINATRSYFIDNWFTARAVVSLDNDGIHLAWNSTDGTDGWIQQKIENISNYIGKPLTLSCMINNIIYTTPMTIPEEENGAAYISLSKSPEIKISVGHYSGTQNDIAGISIITSSTEPLVIKWVKLELGTIATPFVPPDAATELIKSQRYFVRLKNWHPSAYGYNGSGYILSETLASITFSLPTQMRIARPTVNASSENLPCIITPSVPVKTPLTGTLSGAGAMIGNDIALTFAISNGSVGEPALFLLKPGNDYIDISAEL